MWPAARLFAVLMVVPAVLLAGCAGNNADGANLDADITATPPTTSVTTTSAPAPVTPTGAVTTTPTTTSTTPPPAPTPADVVVHSLSVDKGRVAPQEQFLVTVGLRNAGGSEGTGTITILIDDAPQTTEPFRLAGGRETNLSFGFQNDQPGERRIGVVAEGAAVTAPSVMVEVIPAGAFTLSTLQISPSPIELGDVSLVTVTVGNDGATAATGTLRVSAPTETLATKTIQLDPGVTQTLSLQVRPTVGGSLPITVRVLSSTAIIEGQLVVRAPDIQNEGGRYQDDLKRYCNSALFYTVTFDNAGTGVLRDLVVTAIVYLPNGTEHSRASTQPQDVLTGRHAEIGVAPHVTQRCAEDDTYDMRVILTAANHQTVEYDAGRIVI